MQCHRRSPQFPCLCSFIVVFASQLVFAQPLLHRLPNSHWQPAIATWYGSPNGAASTGGACGYGNLVDVRPYKAKETAVSPGLYKGGEGCGACYKVRCSDKKLCSRRAVTVIVTDACPGCGKGSTQQFDLSGAAFSRLAIDGKSAQLRNIGVLSVLFQRTPCTYRGKNIAFRVREGSTNYWFSFLVEFEGGDGDIGSMHIKQGSSSEWLEMKQITGANWFITNGGPLQGPFSVKVTTLSTGRSLIARDVIPRNWTPKATYTSRVNFS